MDFLVGEKFCVYGIFLDPRGQVWYYEQRDCIKSKTKLQVYSKPWFQVMEEEKQKRFGTVCSGLV